MPINSSLNLMPPIQAMSPFHQALQTGLADYGNMVDAAYKPILSQAEAASKLAYANLMGPQYLAKLMGNQDVVANMSDDQRKNALNLAYSAATGQGTGNAILNNGMQGSSQNVPFFSRLMNSIRGNQSPNSPAPANPILQNPNLSAIDRSRISSMQPGDSYVVQGNRVAPQQMTSNGALPTNTQQPNAQPVLQPTNPNDAFYENAARAEGIKKEGEKAGELRAQDMNDLSDIVFNGQTKQATINNLSKIIASPDFEQMRQTAILGNHELAYYQRYGTKAQQNMVGQLVTLSGHIVRDASQDFKGAFRKGEQQLIQNMKVNPGDTPDAARGKLEQLSYLNQMITNRARLTAQYMQQNHMSKLDAQDFADKQLNGDQLRANIHNVLYPNPTDDDINYMAQKHNMSVDEVKKRLQNKGYTLSIKLKGEK